MVRVVIIGGGITGMSAAFNVRGRLPEAEVILLERDLRLGGKVQTERRDGFVIEGGPDSFLTSKPAALDLCRVLGIEDELEGTRPDRRHTFVLHDGRLFEMPQGLSGLVPSRLMPLFRSPLFSIPGKLRIALEAVLPRETEDVEESLGGFMRRRFGKQAYERLIEPLMSGIYGGNGDELSLPATFPQLRAMEQRSGSLIRGIRSTHSTSNAQRPKPAFVTPVAGMASIIDTLEQALTGVAMRFGTSVEAISHSAQSYALTLANGDVVGTDVVIVATPAYAAAALLGGLDRDLGGTLDAIPYASTATVSLAYQCDTIPDLDGYGYVIPRAEGRPVLATTWTSSKFAHRAPDGFALIRAFVGRAGREEILERPDDEIIDIVREELREILHIHAVPLLTRVFRWPRGMPQYTIGHPARLVRIEERLAQHPGLFLAGAAYRGVGIPDCITSGERAAQAAAGYLETMSAGVPR